MSAKKFALYGGIVMFLMGIVSLIPGLEGSTTDLLPLNLELSYGHFMGLFPMNVLNKIALICFGIAGISVGRIADVAYAIHYSRIIFFLFGALAVLGVYEGTNTMGGLLPLYGGEIFSHGIFAVIGGICGFIPSHSTKQRISI